jgi:hypothetical protein
MLPIINVCRWLQIAARTKKMEAGGATLAGKATIGMITAAAVLGLAFIVLALLGLIFWISLLGAAVYVICIVVYFIAAGKLVRTMGTNNETGTRIVTLTRKLASCMLCTVLCSALYTVIAGTPSLFPLEIMVTNFLWPLSYSASHTLIFSFIKESFSRTKARTQSRGTRAQRSTASVTPTAASTAPAQSSSQAWTATVPESPSSSESGNLGSKS